MITLALLIGGHGTRLGGVDKASLVLPSGRTTSEEILGVFHSRVQAVFAVGRRDQIGHPLSKTMPIIVDESPDEGPLRGIATALSEAQTPWVFVVGCDQVGLDADDLMLLTEHCTRQTLAVAWHSPAGPEPLCALYHRSLHSVALRLLDSGERRARALLDGAHFVERAEPIGNINTAADETRLGVK